MRIGHTDFADHVKKWTLKKFVDTYDGNLSVKMDLALRGYTLERAWEKLTGKKAIKDVPKVSDKGKKDKD